MRSRARRDLPRLGVSFEALYPPLLLPGQPPSLRQRAVAGVIEWLVRMLPSFTLVIYPVRRRSGVLAGEIKAWLCREIDVWFEREGTADSDEHTREALALIEFYDFRPPGLDLCFELGGIAFPDASYWPGPDVVRGMLEDRPIAAPLQSVLDA